VPDALSGVLSHAKLGYRNHNRLDGRLFHSGGKSFLSRHVGVNGLFVHFDGGSVQD
jgi:hypothetical protein